MAGMNVSVHGRVCNVVKILSDSVCMFGHASVWMEVVAGEKVEQMFSVCVTSGRAVKCIGQSLVCVCGVCRVGGMLET